MLQIGIPGPLGVSLKLPRRMPECQYGLDSNWKTSVRVSSERRSVSAYQARWWFRLSDAVFLGDGPC